MQLKIDGRPKTKETWELAQLAIDGSENEAVRQNLDFFIRLRNHIVHRYMPALDTAITGEAQAMLLNFEDLLVSEFGEVAALGERLTVPLQLSGFRNEAGLGSLKKAQSRIPVDVMDFLCQHREDVPDEVLRSPQYALQGLLHPGDRRPPAARNDPRRRAQAHQEHLLEAARRADRFSEAMRRSTRSTSYQAAKGRERNFSVAADVLPRELDP